MIELLENLYRENRQGLFLFANSIVGSPDLAEDAVQNAFASLFGRAQDELSPQSQKQAEIFRNGNAVAYVFQSVRNAAIDLRRADARKLRLSEALFDEFRSVDNTDSPPDCLLTKERDDLLKRAIDGLPESDREAIVLKLFAGLTFEEAGQVTQTSPKTIASRYRRALEKLENQLKDQS